MTPQTYRLEIAGLTPVQIKHLLDWNPSTLFRDITIYPEGITGPLHYEIDEWLQEEGE